MMGAHLDSVPFSGIIRIRDMMYSVADPFRLDQGDVSFDAPETVKAAMRRAIDENHSHYVQTTGVPRLLDASWMVCPITGERQCRIGSAAIGQQRQATLPDSRMPGPPAQRLFRPSFRFDQPACTA